MSDWTENKWLDKAQSVAADTSEALKLVFDELNHGQQQKLLKNEKVKELFDKFGVNYG